MARQIVVDILGDATKFTKATQQATTSAGKFSNVLKGVGMGMGIGFTNMAAQASQAVVQFGTDSIKAASNQREAFALTDQVFEENAAALGEWADAKDDAFSTTEALNFASQFGTAFKNVGMSMDETTEKAKLMTRLAGDLGSAFNTSSAEAATALRSGLLGESEPMRKFGVFLDEAKVKAKAAAMGMEVLNGKLTDGQKVAARYALIMEQTADSQGMFGRDSESLADKSKLLQNNIADLQAEIGGPLTEALATGTDTLLAFMKAMDLDAPVTLEERLGGLAGAANTLNPMLWANNYAQSAFNNKLDEASGLAAKAGRNLDTYSEMGAAAREKTYGLRQAVNSLGNAFAYTAGTIKSAVYWGQRYAMLDFPGGLTEGRAKKGKASGGSAEGMTWVGEEGPELVNLPRGSMVYSNARSKQIAGGSGVTVVVNGNIYGPSGVEELMDMMASRLRLDGV